MSGASEDWDSKVKYIPEGLYVQKGEVPSHFTKETLTSHQKSHQGGNQHM